VADKRVARKQPNAVQRFFRETTAELRKVSWPTRKEARSLTVIVIIVMIVTGAILGALDLLFTRAFALLLGG
jgi:preprotein translocase subunit SecE